MRGLIQIIHTNNFHVVNTYNASNNARAFYDT